MFHLLLRIYEFNSYNKEINTSDSLNMCHNLQEPIYITKNGYGDMVIMSIENYESMVEKMKMYEDIQISEKQVQSGQVGDAKLLINETRQKYGL